MAIDYKKTGRAISACRQDMGLSQQGLAELMSVTHQAVSKWENGVALPDTPTLLALSKLFGVTMEALLLGKIEKPDAPEPENAQHAAEKKLEAMSEAIESEIEENMAAAFEVQADGEENVEPEIEGFDVLEADGADEAPAVGIDPKALSRIVGMLPFVSTAMADQLFNQVAAGGVATISQLAAVAPFVSTRTLSDHVRKLAPNGLSREETQRVLTTLAPFLDSKTLDMLFDGDYGAIDAKLASALLPFVSTKTADALVKRMLEEQTPESESGSSEPKKPVEADNWKMINLISENM